MKSVKGLGSLFEPSPAFWAGAASLVACVVYLATLAPTVTWQHNGADSGDLAAAAFTLGIPHPPGYPLFIIVASVFARWTWFEPAHGIGVLVALAGAASVYFLARAAHELSAPVAKNSRAALLASLCALAFAFAPLFWAQATIVEVYTLHQLFAAVLLWAMVSAHPRRVYFAAGALGLGLAHHWSILLLAPGAWLALRPTRGQWRALWLLVAPLTLYAYLPLRAAQDPPVNWGDPRTLENFLWVVTAAPYRGYLFGLGALELLMRVAAVARLWLEQFTPLGVLLGLWGLARLWQTQRRRARALLVSVALIAAYAVVYNSRDSFVYLLPAFAIAALWLAYGAADLIMTCARARWAWLGVAALALLPLYNLGLNYRALDLSRDRAAFNYARAVLEALPRAAVVFADGDEALFALTYYRYVIADTRSAAVIVSQDLLQYAWYYDEQAHKLGVVLTQAKGDAHTRAVEIVNATLQQGRAVCFTAASRRLGEFQYERRGEMWCATRRLAVRTLP